MTVRAVDYEAIDGELLTEQGGTRLDLALQQIFFNSFQISVSQTAAINIESQTVAVTQTAAIPVEALQPQAVTPAPTAEIHLESQGHHHSYAPSPRLYYEAFEYLHVTGAIPIESNSPTTTQTVVLNVEASLDPDTFAVMQIELVPHAVTPTQMEMPLEARFGVIARAWIPFDFMQRVVSGAAAVLSVEAKGAVTGTVAIPLEAPAGVLRAQGIPVVAAALLHPTAPIAVETKEHLVVQATVNIESPPESIAVDGAPSAVGTLTIIRGGSGTLTIHEALPLSESLTN